MIRLYPPIHVDYRGTFVKPATQQYAESFYTFSHANVLRGMHFDSRESEKMVYCVSGKVFDVILDLYTGKFGICTLEANEGIYVPPAHAHGFLSLEPSIMLYYVSREYNPEYDKGIMWNSFGCKWPTDSPVLSERDKHHPEFTL